MQMFTFVVILRIFAESRPEISRIYNCNKWLVLILTIANLALFFYAVFGGSRIGGCQLEFPNSLGGLGLKMLLIVFDTVIFVWHCFDWGLKHIEDETDQETAKATENFK